MSKVLVIADYTQQEPIAISRACDLSACYNAQLHIVYFCYENLRSLPGDSEEIKADILARVGEDVNKQLATEMPEGKPFSHEIVWEKHIHHWVNRYIENNDVTLIVKTGNRSETFLYTPTDWHLLRETKAPVFITAAKKWNKTANILAAVDLETKNEDKQALNDAVLVQAKSMADCWGVDLHVCYTPPISIFLRDLGIQYRDEIEDEARRKVKDKVKLIADTYSIPLENIHITAGEPEKVIPSTAAKYKASVVILGMVGRKGLSGKIFGNTAEKILSLLKTDVLALKP